MSACVSPLDRRSKASRLVTCWAALVVAQTITFSDTFSPPWTLWSNLLNLGNWTGGGGRYFRCWP